ncbi:unnamed protein product [Spodoptera exigua]|nr:unnamed protein product [Spodoptera exigua]
MLWDMFYWFEMMNLFLVGPSELVSMLTTAYEAQTFRDSIKVFRTMPCFGCVVLSMFKSIKMVVHRPVYENLANELRDMWPEGEVSEEEHHIISAALKQLNFIVKGYYWCNNALLISFLSPPYFITLARYFGYDSPMGLHFLYWLPFDPYQPVYYEITLVLQTWHALVVIWFNVAWDMLFCLFLCHITTQFDLLARRVRRLFYVQVDNQLISSYPMASVSREFIRSEGERVNSYSNQYWEARYQKEITEIVLRHHSLISMFYSRFLPTYSAISSISSWLHRLTGDVENMFSLALLINFMNSSIIICFCGFCCVLIEKWNEVAYKSFLVTALSQTWLLCWYGQKLIDSATRNVTLYSKVYSSRVESGFDFNQLGDRSGLRCGGPIYTNFTWNERDNGIYNTRVTNDQFNYAYTNLVDEATAKSEAKQYKRCSGRESRSRATNVQELDESGAYCRAEMEDWIYLLATCALYSCSTKYRNIFVTK